MRENGLLRGGAMKYAMGLVFVFMVSAFSKLSLADENVTITTYYPSPNGVYRHLRLYPSTAPTCNSAADEGTMYFDNSTVPSKGSICHYNGTGYEWADFGASGGGGGFWAENSTTHNIYNTNTGGSAGIGTNNPDPAYKLSLIGIETGVSSPEQPLLHLEGDGTVQVSMRSASTAVAYAAPQILGRRSRGTIASPTPVQTDDELLILQPQGYKGAGGWGTGGCMEFLANGPFTPTSTPGMIYFETTPSGSTTSSTRMVIKEDGNVGIGLFGPQAPLDVNGSMRLAPSAAPASPAEGTMYYDSTQHAPRFRDATQWNNQISESGSVVIPAGQTTWQVNFHKAYTTPPLVIATPVGSDEDMVFVRDFQLTNTFVVFDIDVMTGGATPSYLGQSTFPQEIDYVVIPR